jgi:hypothetical protein
MEPQPAPPLPDGERPMRSISELAAGFHLPDVDDRDRPCSTGPRSSIAEVARSAGGKTEQTPVFTVIGCVSCTAADAMVANATVIWATSLR